MSDSGPGVSADVAKRLFAELFFTNKPRRRGFGLAVAYGVLFAHRGGLRLRPGACGGTVAEIYLPIASQPERRCGRAAGGQGRSHSRC